MQQWVFSLWSDPRLHNWEHFEVFLDFGNGNYFDAGFNLDIEPL
jgi:hypothetical protein